MTRRLPRVFLLLPSFVPQDAIGNDVCGMYHLLQAAGYDVVILAEHVDEAHREIAGTLADDCGYWDSSSDILIYHHSVGWPRGEAILARARNKIAIRYHNVTPPRFFAQYARHYYQACADGELSTRRVARHPSATFWATSRYNSEELIAYGAARGRCRCLAPWHLIEEFKKTPLDTAALGRFRDGRFNILFVGGMKPNKGHALALQVYAAYSQLYGSAARIIFAGAYDPGLSSYFESIRELALRLRVIDDVVFEHSVSLSRLKALYYAADVFLCMSEHEGFCVPLVEAMALRVPVVALGQTGVPETLGDAAIVHDRIDPATFAESLEKFRRDPRFRMDVAEAGRRRYEAEFQPGVLGRKLLDLVEEMQEAGHARS